MNKNTFFKLFTCIIIIIFYYSIILCKKSIKTCKKSIKTYKKYKICIVMWYDDKIKNYADKCYENNKKYCEKYGFDIIRSNKRFYKDRKPHYERFPLILNNLEKYDYVIWVDADAHFYLDSKDISKLIYKYSKYNFILSGDIDDKNIIKRNKNRKNTSIINSGVLIVKNSEYSKKVINDWKNSDELLKRRHGFNDQGIIRLYRAENINNFKKESIVLQYGVIQIFYKEIYYYCLFPYLLFYKPYIIHYAGKSNKIRMKIIKRL